MARAPEVSAEAFFTGHDLARAVFSSVNHLLVERGVAASVRITKSQVAWSTHRGFAYLWTPRRHLGPSAAPAVLTIALGRRLDSARFKEVSHPTPSVWMHHLEVADVADLDATVADWLVEAADGATRGADGHESRG